MMSKGKSNGSRRRTPPAGRSAAVAAPPEVAALVERFRENLESYRDPAYKEARLRREFLDPFFEALGWDLQNKAGHAEAYKDVVHEDALKVGGSTEAPDYGFRVGGQRKFFVEAKKPSVAVGTDVHPAYQLRRYAWSAKLPLAILTDFEELAVYDCRVRPRRTDKSSTARILYMTFEEYAERWGEVAAIFSKEAVLKGSFDRFAEKGRRRGTATVDEAFLEEIEKWRERLARSLALRNPRLSVRDLNAAVQRTIDRIIFLRMCEDRGIEPGGALLALVNGAKIYERLVALFERADDKYNSGLFHFRREPGRDAPDELTPRLRVDDGVLADIIRSLYYPESPYEFSVLGADILGQVYEQFLGKVIRLTAGHHAKVEEKPEVKKAGGVYYTPTYIVRYIVEETVGRLLPAIPSPPLPSVGEGGGEGGGNSPSPLPSPIKGEGKKEAASPIKGEGQKTPVPFSPREASRLRILDPACGSGSFLIGAFERLLDWHRDWYVADGLCSRGNLSLQGGPEKHAKEIYQGAGGEWRLTVREKRRILLNNIFGVDIDGQAVEVTKLSLLLKVLEGENQDSLERQMRLFHEERALPDLASNIKCGNSLIGPDFFDGRQMDLFEEGEVERVNAFDWEREFPAILGPKVPKRRRGFDAVIGNPPYSSKQSIENQKITRFFSCVEFKCDPYAFFVEQGLRKLRKDGRLGYIIPVTWMTNFYYAKLRRHMIKSQSLAKVVLVDGRVFKGANVDTSLLFLAKQSVKEQRFQWLRAKPDGLNGTTVWRGYEPIEAEERFDITPEADPHWIKIKGKIDKVSVRLDTLGKISLGMILRSNTEFISDTQDARHPDPIYFGDDISRYGFLRPTRFFNAKKAVVVGGTKNPAVHKASPKILIQAIRNLSLKRRIVTTLEEHGFHLVGTVNAFTQQDKSSDLRYILGVLNSTLLNTYFSKRFTTISLKAASLGVLPIRRIDLSKPKDKAAHDRMVAFVDRMLDLNKRLVKARSVEARGRLQRLIDRTDREIDGLVYELYGLTEEEIEIVEEGTR